MFNPKHSFTVNNKLNLIIATIAFLLSNNIAISKYSIASYSGLSWQCVNYYFKIHLQDFIPLRKKVKSLAKFKKQKTLFDFNFP